MMSGIIIFSVGQRYIRDNRFACHYCDCLHLRSMWELTSSVNFIGDNGSHYGHVEAAKASNETGQI